MRTIIWLKVTKVVDEYWLLLQSLPSLGEWIEIDRLLPSGGKVAQTAASFEHTRREMNLPKYVKNVFGSGDGSLYH